MNGSWPTTAPITYIVCSRTNSFPLNPRSSFRPATYALSVVVRYYKCRMYLKLTDICLIDILHPICKENIGYDEEVELGDEFALLWCIVVLKPTDLIPLAALFWNRGHLEVFGTVSGFLDPDILHVYL